MSKRSKYTAEEKYEIIKEYESGISSVKEIEAKYGTYKNTLRKWRYNYSKYEFEGLSESKTWRKYSKELKEQAVIDFLSGEYSLEEIIRKYEISGKSVLRLWIDRHNSHRELTATSKGLSQSMTKGRSTSLKERIEIIQYCISQNKNYQSTAEIYHVSYQQVFQWIKKYELGGEEALKDRRGLKKNEEELTPEDRIKIVTKKLEAENQ